MKIAVITPYYQEPAEKLIRCMDSVASQTYPCNHIMVSDGYSQSSVAARVDHLQHIVLPKAHGDYGDTPRAIGTMTAYSQGYDAVCWLDADNWLEPNHVSEMVERALKHGVSVVTATRNLYRPDGTFLDVCRESDGENFNDTNCFFITRPAMALAMHWVFKDRGLAAVGDRVVFDAVKKTVPARSHCSKPTVNYESCVAAHYLERGLVPPPEARIIFRRGENAPFESMLYTEFQKLTGEQ
jgi:glycosyltransferase involved in cell wall biosynthesis